MELLEKAKKQLLLLRKIEKSLEEELKNAPDEKLRVSKSNGVFQYYTIKDGKRIYIRKKKLKIVQAIAQRDYNIKIKGFLKSNIQALQNFTRHYAPQKYENFFLKLPAARKLLIKPLSLDTKAYAKEWQAKKYEAAKNLPPASLPTTRGDFVRSKSEVIIANILNSNKIPYHYEVPVKINDSLTFHPDFFCLNKRTRQEFYWEHCGKIDDPKYSEKLVERLTLYERKDIITGKNLILTMETNDQPLTTNTVEKLIKTFLV